MLGNLGLAALLEQRPDEALDHFRTALVIDRELEYGEGLVSGLVGIAAALPASEEAAMLLGAAHAGARDLAVELEPLEAQVHARLTDALQEALGAARFARAHEAGQAAGVQATVQHALSAAVSAS